MAEELARGRECYRQRAWAEAYRLLSHADQATPLGVEDLELLSMSAYLLGRDDDYLDVLDRAYRLHVDAGESVRAARCAFWLGLRLLFRGETGRATGWLGRCQRLLEREGRDCVEQGYLLLPAVQQHLNAHSYEAAQAVAARAVAIGDRFAESDLSACARHLQGQATILAGQIESGLSLLDEAMLAVIAGELSPLVTGLIYCGVIDSCQQVHAVSRAREWTAALARWCEQQPDMVSFTGVCRVHRSEIMQLQGAWQDAIDEARNACERCFRTGNPQAAAAAFYQRAEVHRLRGEYALAEEAYRSASQGGWEPQPGLALLRMAQGQNDAAWAAIRRIAGTVRAPLERVRLLPAYVEIALAAEQIQEARGACDELDAIAGGFSTQVIDAIASQARGSVELAEGDPQSALGSLRQAGLVWQQIAAPYPGARVRLLTGLACRALGDDDGGELELQAARAMFAQLGATPDLARVDALIRNRAPGHQGVLTPRELQVLKLVVAGKTNKAIARVLSLSEKTIDRHVSNILSKLNVPSRAAATAYAYQHKLL